MMKLWVLRLLTCLCLACPLSALADQLVVEVFYRGSQDAPPVATMPGVSLRHWDLEAPDRIKAEKPDIHGSEEYVRKAVTDWAQSEAGRQYFERVKDAFRGHQQALKYRLKKVPAIVINHEHVVYGSTNVRKAVLLYRGSNQ